MASPEKALLIHGIAMRSEKKVAKLAATLNAHIGGRYELVPVYWGDLGADDTYLHKAIGQYDASAEGFGEMVQDAFARPTVRGAGKAKAWFERQRGDRARSASIEKVFKQRSDDARSRVRGYFGERFQEARLWLARQVLPFTADVIVYQSHTYRRKIHERVRAVIERELGPAAGSAEQPVKVIAHSLGGVVAFDMAFLPEKPLHIEALVTLGSQPSFFHLLDPREGVEAFEGEPITLPQTLGAWTNVWDEYDLLATTCGQVFRLYDGAVPEDVRVRGTRSRLRGGVMLRSHMTYFRNKPTAEAIVRCFDNKADP